ncbi:NRPS [Paraconiothyrium brasiliense]|uniref:NRPS n=1 Tax=Paraconiothyrium brasiliense TaxID=300254 RepID=A0ABR3R556_9PLEO
MLKKIVIGDPITEGNVLVLDDHLKECVEGEICISGPGLAVEYFKNADLTNAKFISWSNRRIYLTGDMGRRTSEGIVFLGRKDSLVKNRGFLINIETEVIPQLLLAPDVQAATALMHNGYLVAFVSPETVIATTIRLHLQQHSDKFHAPDIVVPLPKLPLTSNGKVDVSTLRKTIVKKFADRRYGSERAYEGVFWDAIAHALSRDVKEVSSKDSLWDLGVNSLTAMKLIAYLHQKGVTISLRDLLLASDLQEASVLVRPNSVQETQSSRTARSRLEEQYKKPGISPMTLVQVGLLQPCFEEPMANYLVMVIANVNVDGDKLKEAWESSLRKHSIFSTSFDLLNMTQRVENSMILDWEQTVVETEVKEERVSREIASLLSSASKSHDPLRFRPSNAVRVFIEASGCCSIFWLVHHAQVDGWSMSILMEDINRLLRSQQLPEAPDFSSYALRRARAFDQDISKSKAFWREAVSLEPPAKGLKLPPQSVNSAAIACIASSSSQLSVSTAELFEHCNTLRITAAIAFYAAWALLLSTYTQQPSVGLGIVLSGRTADEPRIEDLVGPVISSCPLLVDIKKFKKKSALLNHIQHQVLQMTDHQGSLDALVRDSESGIDIPSSVMGTVLAIQLDLPKPNMAWAGGEWKLRKETTYPSSLHVSVEDEGDQIITRMQYDSHKYDENAIRRMQQHFHRLVISLLDPTVISTKNVLGQMISAEEHQVLIQKPCLHYSYLDAGDATLKEAFELAVDRWPGIIAAEASDEQLTYSELDKRANAIASILSTQVSPLDHVAVSSDGSSTWLATVLAVIKSGAVYVPVDYKLPENRKKQIIEQSKARVYILAEGENQIDMRCTKVGWKDISTAIRVGENYRLPAKVTPESPAYLVFTSGTTGIPKGVQIAHRQVLALLNHPEARLHSHPGQRNAQTMSVGFDVCLAEIFGTLCFGATLILQDSTDPYAHLVKADATMATPSLLSYMDPQDYPNLHTILLAGEPVPQSLVDIWAPNRRLCNGYGPCECSILVSIAHLEKDREVTIGRSIKGTVCYILDHEQQPVPIGVPGNLYISGLSVSKGYFNQHEATVAAFTTNPFDDSQLMYCTGDVASWTESMEIQYLGRVDGQVKVRGFRVELQEIELAVRKSMKHTVKEVAAIVAEGNIYLFVTPVLVNTSLVHDNLTQVLPHYCLPNRVIALETLPMGSNFKADKRELQRLAVSMHQNEVEQPLSLTENLVGSVWREVLNLGDEFYLSPSSDFYALGGNSVKQIPVVRQLSKKLGRSVPLRVLFRNITLRALATALCASESTPYNKLETSHLTPALSYLEEEIYALHKAAQCSSAFNIVCKLQIDGPIHVGVLSEAVHHVLKSEPMLRSRYRVLREDIQRFESEEITLPVILPESKSATEYLAEDINRPFDLTLDQPFRCIIQSLGSRTLLVFVLHHIIADKTAVNALCKRISQAYGHALNNKHGLPTYSSTIGQNADWVRGIQAQSEPRNCEFWSRYLHNYTRIFVGQSEASIPANTRSLSLRALKNQTYSVRDIHIAACLLAVRKTFGRDDVVLGLPTSYRQSHNAEEPICTCLDRLPVRFTGKSYEQMTKKDLLESVVFVVNEARTNQIPHRRIMSLTGSQSIIDVMVIYHGLEDAYERNFQIPGASVHEMSLKPAWTLFPLLIEFVETSADLKVVVTSSVRDVQLHDVETLLQSLMMAGHALIV